MQPLNGFDAVLVSPIGKLGVKTQEDYLVAIEFLPKDTKTAEPTCSLAEEVVEQLQAFFKNNLKKFDLPLQLSVSSFQRSVLECLPSIPVGKTITYGELAKNLSTSPRAIGNACRRNPIPIVIPCHRVVAQDHLGGYSGAVSGNFLAMKQWLLRHEKIKS